MNLDEKIKKMNIEALMTSSLDVDWQEESLNINSIYADIIYESSQLKTEGRVNIGIIRNNVAVDLGEVSGLKKLLKKLDNKLQNYSIYRKCIRKIFKKVYKGQLLQPVVYVKKLLKYSDREFINVCYQSLLKRSADISGLSYSLQRLRMHEITKIEFIYALSSSEEGVRHGVVLKGGKLRLLLSKCVRKSYRIPVVGKGFRWINNRMTMNKRLYEVTLWNLDMMNQQNDLLQRVEVLEQENRELRRQLGK